MKKLTDAEKIERLTLMLNKLRFQLYSWALESIDGGWSTHQVLIQKSTANKIREDLRNLDLD